MSTTVRLVLLLVVAGAGLWGGAATPLIVMLLTGVALPIVLAGSLALAIGAGCLADRRVPPAGRPYVRAFGVAAAAGVVVQAAFAMAGGWSFGT